MGTFTSAREHHYWLARNPHNVNGKTGILPLTSSSGRWPGCNTTAAWIAVELANFTTTFPEHIQESQIYHLKPIINFPIKESLTLKKKKKWKHQIAYLPSKNQQLLLQKHPYSLEQQLLLWHLHTLFPRRITYSKFKPKAVQKGFIDR